MRAAVQGIVMLAAIVTWDATCIAQTNQPDNVLASTDNSLTRDGDFGGPQVSDSGVGYIDNAILGDQLRFRFDAVYDNVEPARAEFVWPVDGPFGPGPGPETRVDYQDLSLYAERRFACRWSAFGELPFRILNPEIQDNTSGLGDVNVGFKYLFSSSYDSAASFQLRAYLPTGDGTRGLGTRHVSLEPALLIYQPWTDRLALEGEVRDWVSLGGSDGFAGNVLRYGLGASYILNPCDCHPLSAVVEFVGWTVLEGGTAISTPPTTFFTDATGDTIANVKAGLRYRLNCLDSLYAGYGHALTTETWYSDVIRFEYRRAF